MVHRSVLEFLRRRRAAKDIIKMEEVLRAAFDLPRKGRGLGLFIDRTPQEAPSSLIEMMLTPVMRVLVTETKQASSMTRTAILSTLKSMAKLMKMETKSILQPQNFQ